MNACPSKAFSGLTLSLLLELVLVLVFPTTNSIASDIVVPNIYATSPGPSNAGYPYLFEEMRYQQVFLGSQFGGVSGFVDKFAYRPDELYGAPCSQQPIGLQIWFSHTTKSPQALDPVFDNNEGPDMTLVFSGTMVVSSAGRQARLFDIVFDVSNNFFYNGHDNLLLEVKVWGPNSLVTQLDSSGVALGVPGTPWTSTLYGYGVDATTGLANSDDGPITKFTLVVPEPGAPVLSALAITAYYAHRRKLRTPQFC